MLNNDDSVNDRCAAVSHARAALSRLDEAIGAWSAAAQNSIVLTSEWSQAVQFAMSQNTATPWSQRATAAIHGSALAVVELNRLGVRSGLAPLSAEFPSTAELIVALDMIAWDPASVDRLLDAAEAGATVLIDGLTGQFDEDIRLHHPWPGRHADRAGMRSLGLGTSVAGRTAFGVRYNGRALGDVAGARAEATFETGEWSPVETLVYSADSLPVVW